MEATTTLTQGAVVTAVNLLWVSLAIGLIKMLMNFSHVSAKAPAAFTNLILIFIFALIGLHHLPRPVYRRRITNAAYCIG